MIYKKTSPVGIDKAIQRIQTSLYEYAQSKWLLSEAQILSFGRVYRITGQNETLRWYKSGKDYEQFDMLLHDGYALQFFFVVINTVFTTLFESEASLYVFANVATLKPSITHRADEEVKMELFERFKPSEWFGGISDATDLPGYKSSMDIQPYASFKINLNLRYS